MSNLWVDLGVALAIILAIVFLFLNLMFRLRLLKLFKEMQKHRIEMDWRLIFNRTKREAWTHPRYPEHIPLIERFSGQLRRSLQWGGIIFFSLLALASLLIF
jgi:hypothetical protein